MPGLKFPKFSVARLLAATALAAVGLTVLVNSNSSSAAIFMCKLVITGACFGAAAGLIVDRPKLCTLVGAVLWLAFALFAALA